MPSVGDTYIPWRLFTGSLIPNSVLKCCDLSPTAKLIFGRLSQFGGENGDSYPSYNTLALEVGIERRQAMRAVKELEKFGLICRVKRLKDDGGFTSNEYVFLWHTIFSEDEPVLPGDTDVTRDGVTDVTKPRCHSRHPLVSEMPPKENQTKDKNLVNTTTEEIRLLLSGTPLSKISDKELKVLIKRHGIECFLAVADIAAETWRREHKDIRNPGGYFQALCESHVVPEWYEPLEERNARMALVAERKRTDAMKQSEQAAIEEKESQERENHWRSLSDKDREKFRAEAARSLPIFLNLPDVAIDSIAKLIVWEQRSQMDTIETSSE